MFAPEEFIHLARELAASTGDNRSSAARARTAIGRTYYGLFLLVRSILAHRYKVHVRRVGHGTLIRRLQHSSVRGNLRELGRELERLYTFRQKADYEMSPAPDWRAQIEDPSFAALEAARVLAYVERVRAFDFEPVAQLLLMN
jgi:uncharacterized protein (UPF0332 family)